MTTTQTTEITDKSKRFEGIYSSIDLVEKSPIGTLQDKLDFFLSISAEEFSEIVNEILETRNDNAFDCILYYTFLMRKEDHIHNLIQSLSSDVNILESLLIYAYGRALITDKPMETALETLFHFLNQDAYLDLLLNSKRVSKDRMFTMMILTRMDAKSIDVYFGKKDNVSDFIQGFVQLPEETVREVLYKNPSLFGYFRLFAGALTDNDHVRKFMKKYSEEIESIDRIKKIVARASKLAGDYGWEGDAAGSPHLRYLVCEIRKTKNIQDSIRLLEQEAAFINPSEKAIVEELLYNPLLGSPLKKMTDEAEYETANEPSGGMVEFF